MARNVIVVPQSGALGGASAHDLSELLYAKKIGRKVRDSAGKIVADNGDWPQIGRRKHRLRQETVAGQWI
jgi:hypothetical protein